jgi:hypothetical protein
MYIIRHIFCCVRLSLTCSTRGFVSVWFGMWYGRWCKYIFAANKELGTQALWYVHAGLIYRVTLWGMLSSILEALIFLISTVLKNGLVHKIYLTCEIRGCQENIKITSLCLHVVTKLKFLLSSGITLMCD